MTKSAPHSQPWRQSIERPKFAPILHFMLFCVAFVLYANTINHEFALDDLLLNENTMVSGGSVDVVEIFSASYTEGQNPNLKELYRPVTLVNFAIERTFIGPQPRVGHFINVLLFGLTAVFLLMTMRQLFPKLSIVIPAFITLLYVVHPIHTEVVANIKSRDEILCLLFGLVSLYTLFRYSNAPKKLHFLLLSILAFALSTFSKETGITWLAIVPLALWFFSELNGQKIALLTLPYAAVAALYLFARNAVLGTLTLNNSISPIHNVLMSANTWQETWATKLTILAKYVSLFYFPHPLSWDYSLQHIELTDFTSIIPWIALLGLAMTVGICVLRFRHRDPVVFGILFFFITLAPTSNFFIPIASTLGERFLYLPSLGFCIVVILLVQQHIVSNAKTKPRPLTLGIFITVLLLLCYKTVDRNRDWKNNLSLLSQDVLTADRSAKAHWALGATYRLNAANFASIPQKLRNLKLAKSEFEQAVILYPDYADAHYDLGVTLNLMGNVAMALESYGKCLALDPENTNAWNNLGVIHLDRNDFRAALSSFQQILLNSPNNVGALINIGTTYLRLFDYQNAEKNFILVLELEPQNDIAIYNLGAAYFNMRQYNKAVSFFDKVPQQSANYPDAQASAGTIYQANEQFDTALQYYQRALQKNPNHINALKNMAVVLHLKGEKDRALEIAKRVKQMEAQQKQ